MKESAKLVKQKIIAGIRENINPARKWVD